MGRSNLVRRTVQFGAQVACLALLVNQGAWVALSAETPAANGKLVADNSKSKPARQETAEDADREAMVQQLVQSYLPELSDVLKQLRKDRPREYEIAIRDLARAARKLELAQNRDERLFDIEVELLQAENQASLLIAKLKVRDSKSDREKLRSAAKRLQLAQISRAEYDVELFRQRLARSQQQLDAATSRLDSRSKDLNGQLEKTYSGMLRKAGRSGSAKSPSRSSSSNRASSSDRSAEKPKRNAQTPRKAEASRKTQASRKAEASRKTQAPEDPPPE